MSEVPPRWPDTVEDVPVTHTVDAEEDGGGEVGDRSLDGDPLDYAYIMMMGVLREVRKQCAIILMLSDGVTSHCVTATGYTTDDRQILIEVMDPAGPRSFLRAGRNVAGIRAEKTKREGFYLVCHHGLARVYKSSVIVTPNEKENDDSLPPS